MNKIKIASKESECDATQTSCLVLTAENRLLLQKRPQNWRTYPGYICTFGGHIEAGEKPVDAIARELHEELGGRPKASEIEFIAVYTEAVTHFTEIVCGYFWHDKENTITGCYEGESIELDSLRELKQFSLIMDDVPFLISESRKSGFLPDGF